MPPFPALVPPFRRSLATLSLAAALAATPLAAAPAWTARAPQGGTVVALAFDPVDPALAWAATPDSGLWRSDDGGASWRSTAFDRGPLLADLDVDPAHPASILVATWSGLWRSDDGGVGWEPSGPPSALLARGADPAIVWASDHGSIARSADGGRTWAATAALPAGFYVHDLAADPFDDTLAYAATNGGVLVTVDSGAHWLLRNAGLAADPRAIFTRRIAVDRSRPGVVFVVNADGNGIFRSADRGVTWHRILALGQDHDRNVSDLAVVAGRRPTLLVAAAETRPGSPPAATLWRTRDDGVHWAKATAPGVVLTLESERRGDRVLAGLFAGGVARSDDRGVSFADASGGLAALGVSAVAADPAAAGHLVAGLTAMNASSSVAGAGIASSPDGGRSWRRSRFDAPGPTPVVRDLLFDPVRRGVVYAAADDGLWRSRDGGATFEPAGPRAALAALSPGRGGTVFAIGTLWVSCGIPFCGLVPTRVAWRSGDGGATWTPAQEGIEAGPGSPPANLGSLAALAFDSASGRLYAGGTGLFVRTRAAAPWVALPLDGPPGVAALTTLPIPEGPPAGGVAALLLAAPSGPHRLWRSDDGGRSFAPTGAGLPSELAVTRLVATSDAVFAATPRGVWQSHDGGATWRPLGARLADREVVALAVVPTARGREVLAGLDEGPGLFAVAIAAGDHR